MSRESLFHGRPPNPTDHKRVERAFEAVQLPQEPTKRLTIDVPVSLHSRLKLRCVQDGVSIAEVVRDLLENRFPVSQ